MSTLFLRNPRLTLLTIGLITVAGLSSYVILPRMEDPILTERAAFILTSLPGADADQVESLVTDPLEDELRDIAEIKEIRSTSRASFSTITIELQDDVYAAEAPTVWSRIRDRMADAEVELPANASKPRFERIEVTAFTRLIALVWDETDEEDGYGATAPLSASQQAILRRHAEELKEQLLGVRGTKDVEIYGDAAEEIVVEADLDKLASLGLAVSDLSRFIASSDSRFSAGLLRSSKSDLLIELSGKLTSTERIAAIPIQTGPNNQTVTVGDVATIRRSYVDPPSDLAIVQGRRAVVLACLIRPNQRIGHWNKASESVTTEFQQNLSRGIKMIDVFSQEGYVTERLTGLLHNLLIGAASVMIVILFLMGWRSSIVVGIALPLSAFMVLTSMRFMQIPIHQMSITGLIIALGLLIDNAIVVVDEVSQKLKAGATTVHAVGNTVKHLAIPLFGSTFTTALAFGPIALMPGPAGEFVGAIAVNVIVAIFSSLFLAMTVVPALTGFMSSLSKRSVADQPETTPWHRDGWQSPALTSFYRRLLNVVVARPIVGIVIGVALPAIGFIQQHRLPEQFFPPADRDQISIELDLSANASLERTLVSANRIRERLLQTGRIEEVTWWIGRSAPAFYYNQIAYRQSQPQYAQALVKLRNTNGLRDQINEIQADLDESMPQARVLVRQLEQGPPFEAPIEVEVFGPDMDQLTSISRDINRVLASMPEVTHVRSEISEAQPRLTVQVDESAAQIAGLNHQTTAQQMYAALEGVSGGLILEGTEELPVRVRATNTVRADTDHIESLNLLPVAAKPAERFPGVPLASIGEIKMTSTQSAITRINQRRLTVVQAFLKAGVLPAPVLAEFQRRLESPEFRLPPGYRLQFGGEAAQRDDAVGNLMASVGILTVLMIAALVMSFRSFRLAAVVGAVAFLAIGLGLGGLWAFGYPFGFMAIIGTMGLVGVAINDTIVVLAAIREDEAARNGDAVAIREVVIRSTRHVIATSLTTIAGFLPLILDGGSFWPPMAVTIAGGVGGATILALIFVPACYLIVMKRSFQLPTSTVVT